MIKDYIGPVDCDAVPDRGSTGRAMTQATMGPPGEIYGGFSF
jgi:hypothetical protein